MASRIFFGHAAEAATPVVISPPVGSITVTGYATTHDKAILPPVGSVAVTGYAPAIAVTSNAVISIPVGAIALTGYAVTMDKAIVPPVGAIAVTGYAPSLIATEHVVISTPVGVITVTGYAPTPALSGAAVIISPPVGRLLIGGGAEILADGTLVTADGTGWTADGSNSGSGPPTLGFGFSFGVGAATITGLAPSLRFDLVKAVPAGAAAFTGLAPTLQYSFVISTPAGALTFGGQVPTSVWTFGGGGPGMLVVLGLNLSQPNTSFTPDPDALQLTGWAPSWGAGYTYSVPIGAITAVGYAPVVTTASGGQAPVMAAPPALAITGHKPTIVVGRRVRFTFDTDTQGFVATLGPITVMEWIATGNPNGSLSKRVNGNNTTSIGFWRLTTDWISLGIPANALVTGISAASADERVTEYTNGAPGNFSAVTLIPTGVPAIELAAARSFNSAEAGWTNSVGSGTAGNTSISADSSIVRADETDWAADGLHSGSSVLEIPSNGSLTITCGSIVNTGPTGTTAVRLLWDNIDFVISYVSTLTAAPDSGTITATGHAPTVIGLAAQTAQPGVASLSIQGAGPSVFIGGPAPSGGGGGPGLLAALNLNLEPQALGPANLVITGYAPSIFHPITLGGSDDLISGPATLAGTGNKIVAGGSTIEAPANAALVLAGLAPTVVTTGSRTFAMPVTALTFTYYVPTAGISFIRDIPAGAMAFGGFAPSLPPITTLSPPLASLTITGYAPFTFVSRQAEPGVGAITVTGYDVSLAFDVLFSPAPAELAFTGYGADIFGAITWDGEGVLASQPATLSASATVIRHASGTLQSQQPLLFVGSGTRNSTATAALQSGPASFGQDITHGATPILLQSGPATLKARARVIRFKPHHRPKPQRVNRFTVVLKPNKRNRIGKPNRRRPWK